MLRVISPGGSVLASDVIWRSVEKTKEIKPVIVSMGDVAASGGYYISCGANRIFAEANTITGSIGVFGVIPNLFCFSSLLNTHTFNKMLFSLYCLVLEISCLSLKSGQLTRKNTL